MAAGDRQHELAGWKAIADHLGISIRTAQNYEKHGLPVRRLSAGPNGRVLAVKAEVDEWWSRRDLTATEASVLDLPVPDPHVHSGAILGRPGVWRYARWLLGGLAAGALLLSVLPLGRNVEPIGLKGDGEYLVATDGQGKEVWKAKMPWRPDPSVYRLPKLASQRRFQFIDITGDQRPELLAQYVPEDYNTRGQYLYCIGPKGVPLWRYKFGRDVADSRTSFSSVFWANSFEVVNLKGGAERRIAVTATHSLSHPSQVSILDTQGKLLGEYWHSGHLRHLLAQDLDGDSEPELILGGANIGRHRATLVILDPRNLGGASSQPPGDPYTLKGFGKGTEKAVVLFPRGCLGLHEDFDFVSQIRITANRISVIVRQSVDERAPYYLIFDLNWQLELMGIVQSDTYAARHRELEAQALLNHSFSLAEIDRLKGEYRVIR